MYLKLCHIQICSNVKQIAVSTTINLTTDFSSIKAFFKETVSYTVTAVIEPSCNTPCSYDLFLQQHDTIFPKFLHPLTCTFASQRFSVQFSYLSRV